MSFKDKVVIVTGGGQGIGRGISRAFAGEGARVVIADINGEAGEYNCRHIISAGGKALFAETDISQEKSVEKLVNETIGHFGKVDILINNAGISVFGNMHLSSMDLWDRVISVNLRGTYMCSKYCSEFMSKAKSCCIINIASTRAFMSEPDTEAYSASKGGVVALTHSMAVSLGAYKIRVNSISPGWIDVSGWQNSGASKQMELKASDHLQHPAGRVGTPEDIAKACLFLCSDNAGFITGANLMVDGGMTIKMIYEE